YGFINKEGKEVIPPKYKNCSEFNNGTVYCSYDGDVFYTVYPDGREVMIKQVDNSSKTPPKKKCLESCIDCRGTGTRMISTANTCSKCGGTGTSGSQIFNYGGRTHVESKACDVCSGSGRGFGSNTIFEYCKTCNQTGCLKFE
ncbi:MAG: WG repeat-containing protein, partial [Flammeovirgaceae bacterium]|nr:WG repeat-containing protein [Flammeovirgaceae bacterium]MDW8288710.1 WG repeat-containing protein [Flammeovirgaceae bacterium]